jgi:hypothetical protein
MQGISEDSSMFDLLNDQLEEDGHHHPHPAWESS